MVTAVVLVGKRLYEIAYSETSFNLQKMLGQRALIVRTASKRCTKVLFSDMTNFRSLTCTFKVAFSKKSPLQKRSLMLTAPCYLPDLRVVHVPVPYVLGFSSKPFYS